MGLGIVAQPVAAMAIGGPVASAGEEMAGVFRFSVACRGFKMIQFQWSLRIAFGFKNMNLFLGMANRRGTHTSSAQQDGPRTPMKLQPSFSC